MRGRFGLASWALFEWARNPYVLLVTVYIFAPYFARDLVGDPKTGQIVWGEIAGYGGLTVAVLAPFLGAIADAGGRRKPWVMFYAAVMMAAECALWLPQPGNIGLSLFAAGAAVALANVAYDFSAVFHNAMLPSLAEPKRIGTLSGLGYALGNVAGLILLVFVLVFIYLPEHPLFGLDKDLHEHERIVGPLCAVWFLVFSLPFFLFTPDRPAVGLPWGEALKCGLRSVATTVKSLNHYRNVGAYLVARAIYNDGQTTFLLFGGIYAAGVFGWSTTELALYGIVLSVFAAAGGYFGGRLADVIGAKGAILLSLGGMALGGALALGSAPDKIFFVVPVTPGEAVWGSPVFSTLPELLYVIDVMFVAVCLVSTYANSRTMLARIAPEERMAEFFGLYALSGTATAFLAPFAVAWLTAVTHSQQGGMAAILGFLAAGFVAMLFVKEVRATPV